MIKKILIVGLVATTGFIGIRKASQPTDTTTVDLTVENYEVSGDEQTSLGTENIDNVLIGTQQNVTVLSGHNFGAMFVNNYYRDNAAVGSANKVVVKSSETLVENYYAADGEELVFVIDSNNRLIAHMAVDSGYSLTQAELDSCFAEMSTPPGYTLDNAFYYGDDQVYLPGTTTVTDTLILRSKLAYDSTYRTYQVAVEGDTATVQTQEGTAASVTDINFDKQTTVTSTSEYFEYWMIGDKIVSYDSSYTFSVYSDTIIKEVVGTEISDPVLALPVINLYHDEANDDMSSLFECGFEIPGNYTAVEAGMIFGGETYDTALHKVVAESISSDNEFAVRYDNEADYQIHSAYLVCKNSLDEVTVIYDNGYGYEQLYLGDAVGSISGINDAITSSYDTIDVEGQDVFGESGIDGIKMGSSSNSGVLCLTLPDGKLTDKVVVNARAYSAESEHTLVINDSNVLDTLTEEFEYYEINLDEASNEINFDTSEGETRYYINSIQFYYQDRDVEVVERNNNTALNAIEIGDDDTVIDDTTLPVTSMGYNLIWTLDGSVVTELNTTNLILQSSDNSDDFVATIDGTAYSRTITISSIAIDSTKTSLTNWVNSQSGLSDPDNITEDISLPSTFQMYNTSIDINNWTSDNAAIVIDGNTGVVTRGEADVGPISLSYSFVIAGVSYTENISVTVKQYVAPAFLTYDFSTVAGGSNTIADDAEMKTVLDGINSSVNATSLTSITGVSKLQTGKDSYAKISCLKFSTGDDDGAFTMNFDSATTTITRVVVTGCGWKNDGTTGLTVGTISNTFVNAVEWDDNGDTSNYNIQEYEYDIVDDSSVTFQATNRVLVTRIDLYTD